MLRSDPTDLAVLEIPAKYVTKVAKFGNSEKIKAGNQRLLSGTPLD
ncbi:hypothetical protein GCM10007416_33130 [Kroppenstedtia guangzhouensis]|uniref:Uncharacterized protein n=1 Tax=Kroppenstedtia guangzhouensis TaxID=1274356 RepID=A0ABQ1H3W5_9BACL|nr:hypothetical protein GCM10007416_33130 [Kroppenstedtia guangzhouensis]